MLKFYYETLDNHHLRWYNILWKEGKTVSKKKQRKKKKPTKLKYAEILITALMDLIIGTLLLIIGKIIE